MAQITSVPEFLYQAQNWTEVSSSFKDTLSNFDNVQIGNLYKDWFKNLYLNPLNWKLNDLSFPTQNWIILRKEGDTSTLGQAISDIVDRDARTSILLTDIMINISKDAHIIETRLAGNNTNSSNSTVKQFLGNSDFNINITGTIAGEFFWSPDVTTLKNFKDIIEVGETLDLINLELNNIYDIDKAVVYSSSINQNTNYFSLRNFTLNLKSDKEIQIIDV